MADALEILGSPVATGLVEGRVPGAAELSAFTRGAASGGYRLVVGGVVTDGEGRVFVQRRSPSRALFPGAWDIVGGHAEAGEDVRDVLLREIREETGWRLGAIGPVVKLTDWRAGGVLRREVDVLVTVEGDLAAPVLEPDKHDLWRWLAHPDRSLLAEGRTEADVWLQSLIERAFELLGMTGFGRADG